MQPDILLQDGYTYTHYSSEAVRLSTDHVTSQGATARAPRRKPPHSALPLAARRARLRTAIRMVLRVFLAPYMTQAAEMRCA